MQHVTLGDSLELKPEDVDGSISDGLHIINQVNLNYINFLCLKESYVNKFCALYVAPDLYFIF